MFCLQSLKLVTVTLMLSLISPLILTGTKLEIFNDSVNAQPVTSNSKRIEQQIIQENRQQALALKDVNSLQDKLRQLNQNAVLLYPLIQKDRIKLVLVAPNSPPISRSVPVKQEEVKQAIAQFKSALQKPSLDAKVPAQTLYNWLIKPIENDLTQANTKTIIFAPDQYLRHLPLAALYDGNHWLVERFSINNITAASLTNFNLQHQTKPRILAAAFSEKPSSLQVGTQEFKVVELPHAVREVKKLATIIPNTTILLGRDFNPEVMLPHLNDYNIIHLATNTVVLPSQPEESFMMFGDGSRLPLPTVATWKLAKVDLVVLRGNNTAVGSQLPDGVEAMGFGYYVLNAGAKAVIASVGNIDDEGTQVLMHAFYQAIAKDNITKAEALRQAQLALVTGDVTTSSQQKEKGIVEVHPHAKNHFSHPYYWASFILIGNGL